jgi:hypothetical protein
MKKLVALTLFIMVFASFATSDSPPVPDAEFTFARVQFNMTSRSFMDFREAPWHHDYPFSEDLILTMLTEVTRIHTTPRAYKIVQLSSPDIFQYPFLYVSEPGYMDLTDKETVNLRNYLNRGGFVMFDDFRTAHGSRDMANLRVQMKKVFPDRDFFRLDARHPVFHTFYDLSSIDMPAPYYQESMVPEFMGMNDDNGVLQIVANHNNDFGEFWEWVDKGEMEFQPAAQSVKFGINYLIYAMTH